MILAPPGHADGKGVFTGMGMLACVILLGVNGKARTKPICLWGVRTHLGIFSVLLWVGLSYINASVGVVVWWSLSGWGFPELM